jgi:hypothetical protein
LEDSKYSFNALLNLYHALPPSINIRFDLRGEDKGYGGYVLAWQTRFVMVKGR